MKIKEFKEKEIPKFKFDITVPGHVLVQVFYTEASKTGIILTDNVKSNLTEIKNVFKVLTDTENYKSGDIVSVADHLVDRPIVSWKNPEGNDPEKAARPVYGVPLTNMQSYVFDCNKTMEEDYDISLVFLIPEQFITVKHHV